ncbi:MAG: hypothetical protein HDS82_06025 [Bacteroidales bacterium]|nr:hypothetical protein [Bacteroidales bacterium]
MADRRRYPLYAIFPFTDVFFSTEVWAGEFAERTLAMEEMIDSIEPA